MPDFINTFPAGTSLGSFVAGVGPVGVSPSPAAAGQIIMDTEFQLTLQIVKGMLPMKFRIWGAGGLGGVNADDSGTHNGTGGGGGGYAEGVIPEGVIAYGSVLDITNGIPGTFGDFNYATESGIFPTGPDPVVAVWGGNGGTSPSAPASPGFGGGNTPGFPNIVMDGVLHVVIANGINGAAGGTGTVGNGGAGAGPGGGAGGVGSYISSGLHGSEYGGGGGGTRTGGGRVPGNGARGRVELTWPAV